MIFKLNDSNDESLSDLGTKTKFIPGKAKPTVTQAKSTVGSIVA